MDLTRQYKYQILDSFWLKIVGFILMTVDHVGMYLQMFAPAGNLTIAQVAYWLRVVGRLAFPLFALMLAEGLLHTRNKWKYLGRLGIVGAAILIGETIAFSVLQSTGLISGLFTAAGPSPLTDLFLYALIVILITYPKWWAKLLAIIPIAYIGLSYGICVYEDLYDVTVTYLPYYLRSGYHWYGLCLVLGFYFAPKIVMSIVRGTLPGMGVSEEAFKETAYYRQLVNVIGCAFLFFTVVILWGVGYIPQITRGITFNKALDGGLHSWALLSILFVMAYSGKKGYDSKGWRIFEYAYFPGHMVLLCAIMFLIFS